MINPIYDALIVGGGLAGGIILFDVAVILGSNSWLKDLENKIGRDGTITAAKDTLNYFNARHGVDKVLYYLWGIRGTNFALRHYIKKNE